MPRITFFFSYWFFPKPFGLYHGLGLMLTLLGGWQLQCVKWKKGLWQLQRGSEQAYGMVFHAVWRDFGPRESRGSSESNGLGLAFNDVEAMWSLARWRPGRGCAVPCGSRSGRTCGI